MKEIRHLILIIYTWLIGIPSGLQYVFLKCVLGAQMQYKKTWNQNIRIGMRFLHTNHIVEIVESELPKR